ncbi:MAG: N-acetyltransferase [Actinomycetota bacterium]
MTTRNFVLEPLGPQLNESDFAAWSTSIEHIRATPGFRADLWGGDEWPYPMTREQNLADLTQHADEFNAGDAFAYTVLDPHTRDVIGCVYIDPDDVAEARCRLWVRADRAELDGELEHVVRKWLRSHEWGLESVRFPGRDS